MYYNTEDLCLDGEVWKDVVDWEEFYQVSNMGRVKVKERVMFYDRNLGNGIEKKTVYEKIRKPKLNKHTGYLMVGLNGKGKCTNLTIHSMVARAFIADYRGEGKGNGFCTNHKDGNKLNNFENNLEVIRIADNVRHMFLNNLTTTNHKIKYNENTYYSKSEMKRSLGVSESKLKKLIKDGLAVVIN